MRTMELYFNDLTAEAQKKYLEVAGVSDPSELNWEVSPIAIIGIEENENEDIRKGIFVSVWSDGCTIETSATLNPKTGEVTADQSNDTEDHGSLEREYFEYKNRKHQACEVEVCTTCHSYIMKTVMNPGIGHDLNEEKVCADPDCESNQ